MKYGFNWATRELGINEDREQFHTFMQGVELNATPKPLQPRTIEVWQNWYDIFVKACDSADLADTQADSLGTLW
jgi:hypothetical protein